MRKFTLLLLLLFCCPLLLAQTKPPVAPISTSSERLPVKRVVLYKNGVGYFEHTGQIQGTQQVNIDFTTAQLDDVIKSLTVIDLGKGKISGIRYNSTAPLEQRLRTLRLPLGQQTSQREFLNALRGSRLEVRSGAASVTGRLLSIDIRSRFKAEQRTEVTELSIITDSGELRTVEVTPATNIRIVDSDLNQEVGRYLSLIASTRERDIRRMTIAAEGIGDRKLFVSYISEVPVWKSTYRIVMPTQAAAKPLLQGWAIVDNTVGEDWKDIELSLVAGAPQSFIQHISQPLYSRRPVVPMHQTAQLTPQAHESTMNSAVPPPPASPKVGGVGPGYGGGIGRGTYRVGGGVVGGVLPSGSSSIIGQVTDPSGGVISGVTVTATNNQTGGSNSATTDASGNYNISGIASGNYTLSFDYPGFQRTDLNTFVPTNGSASAGATLHPGSATETVYLYAGEVKTDSSTSDLLEDDEAEAEGKEVGELYEYKLKQKVTIGKNQSALVPIVQAHIDAEKVSLWNQSRGRALRALWVNNTSDLTLDAGTFNILENDTFAGEGLLEIIRPGEKRLLSYAVDQSVKVDSENESERERVTRVRIVNGVMTQTSGLRNKVIFTVRNNDDSPRNVVIEQPVQEGWKIISETKPEESTSSFHRFRVEVAAHETKKLEFTESQIQNSTVYISNISDDQITAYVNQRNITPELETVLRRVVAQKGQVNSLDLQIRQRQKEMADIATDQQRLRENMKALKGSSEEKALLQRYTSQLNQQEDRLDAVRKEVATLESDRDKARKQLELMVSEIKMDIDLTPAQS